MTRRREYTYDGFYDAARLLHDFIERGKSERRTRLKLMSEAHCLRVRAAACAIPDYWDVVARMAGIMVKENVIEEIMLSDRSGEVAYYLAANPLVFDQVKDLEGRELTFAIGRVTGLVDVWRKQRVRVKAGRVA